MGSKPPIAPPAEGQPVLGRNVIVTGGSQGLGRAIVEALIDAGANVLFCARTDAAVEQARAEIAARRISHGMLIGQSCDIADERDVARLLARAETEFGGLHAVINNAGIQGPIGPLETNDPAAWRRCIEVNLIGTMFVCRGVIPIFKSVRYGKIVNVSGGGATSPRPEFSAYAASKAAVVRLTETLAEELREHHIDVNAVAPGALKTRMFGEILAAASERVRQQALAQVEKRSDSGDEPMAEAAALCVYLASAASDGITGRLLAAKWDPWRTLHERRGELAASDIYTLRRIVAEDRGSKWSR